MKLRRNIKKFNVLDGYGIKNLIHSGISVGLISSRDHQPPSQSH